MALATLTVQSVQSGAVGSANLNVPAAEMPSAGILSAAEEDVLAQEPLRQAAIQIRSVVENGNADGLTGIALRDDHVHVLWKGKPPGAVAAAIAQARTVAPVRVSTTARYSLAELNSAADGVLEQIRANPRGPIHSVEVPTDGTGLVIGADSHAARIPRAAVPVKIVKQERISLRSSRRSPVQPPDERFSNHPPFRGGAAIAVRDGFVSRCTTGFAVKEVRGSRTWMLTAGHCGQLGDIFMSGDLWREVGPVVLEDSEHDTMLIESEYVRGRIYATDGPGTPWPPGARLRELPVRGWDHPIEGEHLCHSGWLTGTMCGFRQTNRRFDTVIDGEIVRQLEVAERTDGRLAAVSGDSGGPVFSAYYQQPIGAYEPLRPWRAIAKGIISGTKPTVFMGTHDQLVYQDFEPVHLKWGVTTIFVP